MRKLDSIKNTKDLFEKHSIKQCIEQIESDYNRYPLFYNPIIAKRLNSADLIEDVINKLNPNYIPEIGITFKVPYDFISDRDSVTIQLKDLVIRYLIMNLLKEFTGYEVSTEEEDDKKISNFLEATNNKSQNIFKIDLFNYYESIDHQVFLSKISDHLKIGQDHPFYQLFSNCLAISVVDSENNIIHKKNGLCIGLKPDEYFGDLFMWLNINEINTCLNLNLFHIADEIIFSSSNLNESRVLFNSIESILTRNRLRINKSKNKSIALSFPELERKKKLIIKNELDHIKGDSYFKSWAQERGGWFQYELNDVNSVKKEEIRKQLKVINEDGEEITQRPEEIYNIKLDSYQESIRFIKLLIEDIQQISHFQKKHPEYQYFHNIVFSKPKDFVLDYENLKFYAFDPFLLKQLLTIIYQFPRSEYYSSIALEILAFVAKNSSYNAFYCYDREKFMQLGFSHLISKLSDICELSNISIIELLRSKNIHDYQKYLLIRSLYKNVNDLNFSLNNFKNNLILYDDDPWFKANPDLPFPGLVYTEIKRLCKESKNYALTTLCNYITSL